MASLLFSRQAFEPGLQPPPGVVLDPTHTDKGLWKTNIATQSICLPTVTVLVILRLVSKSKHRKSGLDDVACVLGWMFTVAYSTIALLMANHGAGIHQWNVDARNIIPYTRLVYATMIVYGPCAFFIKASILLFCARIFSPRRSACITIYTFLAIMAAYYLPVLVLKALICRPLSHFWDPASTPNAQCFNQRILILCDSLISIITDSAILLIPLPLASRLQMPLREKFKIAIIFGAGGFATVCSLVRMIDIARYGLDPDTTFVFMRINLWGIAECNIGLICSCLPTLHGLWKQFRSYPTSYIASNSRPSQRESVKQSPIFALHPLATPKGNVSIRADSIVPASSRTSSNAAAHTPARSKSILSVRNPDPPELASLNVPPPAAHIVATALPPAFPSIQHTYADPVLHHRTSSINTPLTSVTETIVRGPSAGSSKNSVSPLNASSCSLAKRQIEEVEMGTAIVKTVEVEQIETVAEEKGFETEGAQPSPTGWFRFGDE